MMGNQECKNMSDVRIRRDEIKGMINGCKNNPEDIAEGNDACQCEEGCDCDDCACEWHND